MRKVVSRDGTTIAYEKTGDGPPIVLLGGAFRDHTIFTPFIPVLAPHFTTYVYDRRGRGESGNAPTWSVEREVEDLEAVIAEAGGEAAVFGGSGGAILALEAAMAGAPITKLVAFEPPYRVEGISPPMPDDFTEHLRSLLKAEKRGEAAEYFLTEMGDFSPELIAEWRQSPIWPANEAMAHTLLYDTAMCLGGLRVEQLAKTEVPTLVINSDKSYDWLEKVAQATAAALPNGRHLRLPGVWHRVPIEVLGPAVIEFVKS
jgi:pimeloyl-ACP methyl ester carboxylesterase